MTHRFIITNRPGSQKKKRTKTNHYHLDILLRNRCFSNNRYCILELTSDVKSKSFIYLNLFCTIAHPAKTLKFGSMTVLNGNKHLFIKQAILSMQFILGK